MRDAGLVNGLVTLKKYMENNKLTVHGLWKLIQTTTHIPIDRATIYHLLSDKSRSNPATAITVAIEEATKGAVPIRAWVVREVEHPKTLVPAEQSA